MRITSLLFAASMVFAFSACPPAEEETDAAVVDAAVVDAGGGSDSAVQDSAAGDSAAVDQGDTDSSVPPPSCDNDDSYEDNDEDSSAAAITAPGTIDNLMGCDEYDWYKFTVPAGNGLTVAINFTDAESDLDLAIYDAADATTTLDSSSGISDNEMVSVELFEASTDVLVRVKNFGYPDTAAAYSMVVTFHEGGYCENDNFEPNETAEAAHALEGRTASGILCPSDVDYYSFTLPTAGENASVTVSREANQLDVQLFIQGSTDAIGVLTHDETDTSDKVTFTSALDTTYILRIAGDNLAHYTLDITAPPPSNDICDSALTLTPGTAVNGTTIDASNSYQFALGSDSCAGFDMDGLDVAYLVTVPAGQYLTASLDSSRDLAMYLLDDCATRCCWVGVDNGFGGDQEVMTYHNISGAEQTLFLIVDSFSAYTQGDFSLLVDLAASDPVVDAGSDDAGEEPSACMPDDVADAGMVDDAAVETDASVAMDAGVAADAN